MGPVTHVCGICEKSFVHKSNLNRHQRTIHGSITSRCQYCGASFNRRDSYLRHVRSHHRHQPQSDLQQNSKEQDSQSDQQENNRNEEFNIQVGAGIPAAPSTETQNNESEEGNNPIEKENDIQEDDCITSEEAIEGNLKKITIEARDKTKYDPMTFLKVKEEQIRKILKEELKKRRMLKFYITIQVRFTKNKGDQVEITQPYFHGKCHILLKTEDMEGAIRESFKKIINSFIEYQREGSNWTLDKVLGVNIHTATYRPMKGSSFLPLPAKMASKKAIINVQNHDDKCFMWAVLASLHPINNNPQRFAHYAQYAEELDFTDIPFPVKVCDINKFEKLNDISVNVFGYEHGTLYPLHLTKVRGVRHVNLLLISKGEKYHYCWIKNFDRLLSDGQMHQRFHCHYCLHGFTKKKLLQKHEEYCQVHGAQRTEMPSEEDKWLKFTDISKQLKCPYAVYSDFESILEKILGCQPDQQRSSTIKLAKHVPSGFTYKVVGLTDDLTEKPVTYRGPKTAEKFVEHMLKLEERLTNVLRNPKPMIMSDEDISDFQNATHCSICADELGADVVRDHCHVTGKYRGAAHSSCNLNYRQRERIPVFFHNLSYLRGYDAHHIMSAIGKFKHKRLNCIPQNHEKYISFSLGKLDLIDTFQFMSTSLEKLVDNLAKEGEHKFQHLRSYIQQSHGENEDIKLELLSRKGVYPYRYMDSFDRFQEKKVTS